MKIIRDITGQRFGRLVALRPTKKSNTGKTMWLFQCDCGKEHEAIGDNITHNGTKSCGCLRADTFKRITRKTHGCSKTPEYAAWHDIKRRCFHPQTEGFHYYGGRGISMCNRWKSSFENFLLDMGHRPTLKHSIERIDVNGNYEPSNCKWATAQEQCLNKRANRLVEFDGKTQPVAEWARCFGIKYNTFYERLRRAKWSMQNVVENWGLSLLC